MRTASYTMGLIGLISTAAAAQSMYSWRDASGTLHYSNVPVTSRRTVPLADADVPHPTQDAPTLPASDTDSPTPANAAVNPGPTPPILADAERSAFSDRVSAQRRELQRVHQTATRRIAELERQLKTFRTARVQHASLGTNAANAVSAEEQPLLTQKVAAEKERDQAGSEYAALAAEVTQQLGALPDWWIALR